MLFFEVTESAMNYYILIKEAYLKVYNGLAYYTITKPVLYDGKR